MGFAARLGFVPTSDVESRQKTTKIFVDRLVKYKKY